MNEEVDERSRKSSTQFGQCHQRDQNHQRAGINRAVKEHASRKQLLHTKRQ